MEQLLWLTQEEFLQKYWCFQFSFWRLVEKIKDHPVFNPTNPCGRKHAPVQHQLLVMLHYLGTSGSGTNNPHSHNVFGICCSTVELYKTRCVAAILSLQPEAIKWPSEEERKEIGKRVINKFQIPNCIAIADGTLFPLLQEPRTVDALDYHGRKHPYSLSVMIVNDNRRYIHYYLQAFQDMHMTIGFIKNTS